MQASADDTTDVLFLNILVKDGSGAVEDKVTRKLRMLPKGVKERAAKRASRVTPCRVVAKELSQELLTNLPSLMKEKGVTINVQESFREDSFFVLELRVVGVDMVELTKSEFDYLCGFVTWMVDCLGEGVQRSIEKDYLPYLISTQLAWDMPQMLDESMTSARLVAEARVISSRRSQERFFTRKVKELRGRRDPHRSGLLKKVRRRLSQRDGSDSSTTSTGSGGSQTSISLSSG